MVASSPLSPFERGILGTCHRIDRVVRGGTSPALFIDLTERLTFRDRTTTRLYILLRLSTLLLIYSFWLSVLEAFETA